MELKEECISILKSWFSDYFNAETMAEKALAQILEAMSQRPLNSIEKIIEER